MVNRDIKKIVSERKETVLRPERIVCSLQLDIAVEKVRVKNSL